MTHLDNQWAWSQVEAMADGTLPRADRKRMRTMMAADARLREAVELAATVRSELARLARGPVPAAQQRRLLRIPSTEPRTEASRGRHFVFAAGLAAAALAAVALTALLQTSRPPPPAPPEAQARAVADFAVAMTYLQRSTEIAGSEVTTAVRGGLRGALAVSRDAVRDHRQQPSNGD